MASSLIYVIEAWILSIVFFAWIALKDMLYTSLLDTFVSYSLLGITTIHLAVTALFRSNHETSKAYFCAVCVLISVYAYGIAEAYPTYTIEPPALSNNGTYVGKNFTVGCCPNRVPSSMYRSLFFGGSKLFLVPSAISMGFLLVLLLVAGASTSSEDRWPGHTLGFSLAMMVCSLMFIQDSEIIQRLCPTNLFTFWFLWDSSFKYAYIWGGFGCALILPIVAGVYDIHVYIFKWVVRLFYLCIMGMFCLTVAYSAYHRHLLSVPLMVLLGKCALPVLLAMFPVMSYHVATQPPKQNQEYSQNQGISSEICPLPAMKRTRWLVPIQSKMQSVIQSKMQSSKKKI